MSDLRVKAAAVAAAAVLAVALGAGCVPSDHAAPSNLELPQVVWDALERMMPLAEVEGDAVPVVADDLMPVADDPDVSDKELHFRPVVINIHNLGEALAIVEGLGNTDSLTVFGTFSITKAMLDKIQAELDKLDADGFSPAFLLLDLETGAGLAYHIDEVYYSGSGVMGINMTGLCALDSKAFSSSSAGIESAVKYSSNSAYEAVFDNYDANTFNKWREKAHLDKQDWGKQYTRYTTRQFAQLWLANWDYLKGDSDAAKKLREWMEDSRQSAFAAVFGQMSGYTNCSKPGWESGDNATCNEGGYVVTPDGTYLLCIMCDDEAYPDEKLVDLVKVIDEAYRAYAPDKVRD